MRARKSSSSHPGPWSSSWKQPVAIELGQYFHILRSLGLEANTLAVTVLGNGYEPRDFLAYAAGALGVLAVEAARSRGARR